MTFALAGAIAVALSASCVLFAAFARGDAVTLRVRHPDRRALADANWRRPLWQWEVLRASCTAAGAVLSVVMSLPLVAVLPVVAVAPSLYLRSRAEAARWRARLATTQLLRATEAAVRSGASLPEALRRACDDASGDRLARRPFVEALRAFDLGAPLDQALQDSADHATDTRSRIALETLAMGIASRLPYERAGVLVAGVADRLAFEERLDEEIRARTGGLRSQVLLLALVVPAIGAYLAFTVPTLAATLDQPIGRFVLIPAATILEVFGVIASRRAIEGARR